MNALVDPGYGQDQQRDADEDYQELARITELIEPIRGLSKRADDFGLLLAIVELCDGEVAAKLERVDAADRELVDDAREQQCDRHERDSQRQVVDGEADEKPHSEAPALLSTL